MNRLNDWNPFEQLKPLTSGLDELNKKEFVVPDWMSEDKAKAFYRWQPHLELKETQQNYVMEFLFDDVVKEDIQVSIGVGELTVIVKRETIHDDSTQGNLANTKKEQVYQKTFQLPSIIDREKISAAFKGGRLAILLPKLNEEERQLEIE